MREIILICLGITTGLLMLGWGLWQIKNYWRSKGQVRHSRRFYGRIAYAIALIGLADLSKAIRELFIWLGV